METVDPANGVVRMVLTSVGTGDAGKVAHAGGPSSGSTPVSTARTHVAAFRPRPELTLDSSMCTDPLHTPHANLRRPGGLSRRAPCVVRLRRMH